MWTTSFRTAATVLAAVFLVLAFASSPASAQDDDDPARVDAGKDVFENNCSGCHGVDGAGSATGRPLVNIAAEEDRDHHIASVVDGKGRMPAFGSRLSDEEVADVVSYIRLTFVADDADAEASADDGEASTDDGDDDGDDENESGADDAPAAPALAKTGAESVQVVIVGMALILAGIMMLQTRRRFEI